MKLIKDDKSGFTLINVIISLVILSVIIAVVLSFNSYISKEEAINEEEFFFYSSLNNLSNELYSMDWEELKLMDGDIQTRQIKEDQKLEFKLVFSDNLTEYNTEKLDIHIINPPESIPDDIVYHLEKFNSDK